MTRWTALLTCGLFVVSLAGCAAQRHLESGDAAAAGGDMRAAVYHYQRALGHQRSLARDAGFTAKLAAAESRVAYDEAVRLRGLGRYEPAIDQLRRSIERDPGYAAPSELMPAVRAEAAQWRLGRALAAADGGDLSLARSELERALRHDMANEDAASAMASLSVEQLPARTAGLDAYREGVALSAERRWAQAERALAESAGLNAHLLPARAKLHAARQAIAESESHTAAGRTDLADRQIGPAIERFSAALSVWPFNEPAGAGLAAAQHQRALADERLDAANGHATARAWDQAIEQADAGLAIDRSHPALRELRGKLAGRAAADYTERGDAHRAAGELDAAHRAYARALGYAINYTDARRGLAAVHLAWAAQARSDGRLGLALLHSRQARDEDARRPVQQAYANALSAVRGRVGMGLGIEVSPAERGGAVPAGLVRDAMQGALSPYRGDGLSLDDPRPRYVVSVVLRDAVIDQRLTASADRSFAYTTREWRHNPEYDRVARRLDREIATYDRVCREYERATGRGHHGHHGHAGHAGHEHDAHAGHLYDRVARQRRTVDHWKHQLACTPRQVQVSVRRSWPFTLETHTKLGRLSGSAQLIDTATGDVVDRLSPAATFSASDDTILNANPAVGLQPDALRLPSDGEVREVLAIRLAEAAAPEVLHLAVQHRLASIGAQAAALRDRGEHPAALEHEVDAVVLLQLVDPDASAKRLADLAAQHTR